MRYTYETRRLFTQITSCSFEQHIRDYMVIEYADLLLSTPEYWNIACNYLATAGDIGIGRMRSVLLHVGLRNPSLPSQKPADRQDDMVVDQDAVAVGEGENGAEKSSDLDRVESVLRAAEEYRLEGVTKEICRVSKRPRRFKVQVPNHEFIYRSCPGACSMRPGSGLLSRSRYAPAISAICV